MYCEKCRHDIKYNHSGSAMLMIDFGTGEKSIPLFRSGVSCKDCGNAMQRKVEPLTGLFKYAVSCAFNVPCDKEDLKHRKEIARDYVNEYMDFLYDTRPDVEPIREDTQREDDISVDPAAFNRRHDVAQAMRFSDINSTTGPSTWVTSVDEDEAER